MELDVVLEAIDVLRDKYMALRHAEKLGVDTFAVWLDLDQLYHKIKREQTQVKAMQLFARYYVPSAWHYAGVNGHVHTNWDTFKEQEPVIHEMLKAIASDQVDAEVKRCKEARG